MEYPQKKFQIVSWEIDIFEQSVDKVNNKQIIIVMLINNLENLEKNLLAFLIK